jgi:hypothetical protein
MHTDRFCYRQSGIAQRDGFQILCTSCLGALIFGHAKTRHHLAQIKPTEPSKGATVDPGADASNTRAVLILRSSLSRKRDFVWQCDEQKFCFLGSIPLRFRLKRTSAGGRPETWARGQPRGAELCDRVGYAIKMGRRRSHLRPGICHRSNHRKGIEVLIALIMMPDVLKAKNGIRDT